MLMSLWWWSDNCNLFLCLYTDLGSNKSKRGRKITSWNC